MAPLFGYIIDRQCSSDSNCTKPSKDTEKQHQKFMMDIEDTPKVIEFVIQCNRKRVFKINDAVLVTASSTVVFCLLAIIPNLVVQVIQTICCSALLLWYGMLWCVLWCVMVWYDG